MQYTNLFIWITTYLTFLFFNSMAVSNFCCFKGCYDKHSCTENIKIFMFASVTMDWITFSKENYLVERLKHRRLMSSPWHIISLLAGGMNEWNEWMKNYSFSKFLIKGKIHQVEMMGDFQVAAQSFCVQKTGILRVFLSWRAPSYKGVTVTKHTHLPISEGGI